MGSPQVRQLQMLSDVFAECLDKYNPRSLAVLGCATGNGLRHINPDFVTRVVGVDISPAYLAIARQRYADRLPQLELICQDVATCDLGSASLSFVYAALVFEYVQPRAVVERVADWLEPGGVFVAVLQLPSTTGTPVSQTTFRSLERLAPVMTLVDPDELAAMATAYALASLESKTVTLHSGKSFHIAAYQRPMQTGGGVTDSGWVDGSVTSRPVH